MSGDGKATIASSLIAGVVALLVAWITTGAKFSQELKATSEAVAAAKAEVGSLQGHLETLEGNITAANKNLKTVTDKVSALNAAVHATAVGPPVASYLISHPSPFPYYGGSPTRVNFDKSKSTTT
jgi:hypothetical protein